MGFSKVCTRSHVRVTVSVSLSYVMAGHTLPYDQIFRLDGLLLLLLFFYKYRLPFAIESLRVPLISSILNKLRFKFLSLFL